MDDRFVIRYKDFSIIEILGIKSKYDYEIVKYNGDQTCFTIGWLIWEPKEQWFELDSCGLRLMEYYEPGLDEFIIKTCEVLSVCKRRQND